MSQHIMENKTQTTVVETIQTNQGLDIVIEQQRKVQTQVQNNEIDDKQKKLFQNILDKHGISQKLEQSIDICESITQQQIKQQQILSDQQKLFQSILNKQDVSQNIEQPIDILKSITKQQIKDEQIKIQVENSQLLLQKPQNKSFITMTKQQGIKDDLLRLSIKQQQIPFDQLKNKQENKQLACLEIINNPHQQQLVPIKKSLKLVKVYQLNCTYMQNGILSSSTNYKTQNIITIQQQKYNYAQGKDQKIRQQEKKQKKLPLKVQNLFISSLLSGNKSSIQIKGPEVVGEKKLKPWQRMKKSVSAVTNIETEESIKKPIISTIPQEGTAAINQLKENNDTKQKVNDFLFMKQNQAQLVKKNIENSSKLNYIENLFKKPAQQINHQNEKIEQKKQQIKPITPPKNTQFIQTEFHQTTHNPLLQQLHQKHAINQPLQQSSSREQNQLKPPKQDIQIEKKEEHQEPFITKELQAQLHVKNRLQTNKMEDYMRQNIPEVHEEVSSQSQEQDKMYEEMNKKRLQQEQSRKKKMAELEIQLNKQKQINKDLQKSVSLGFKLMASSIAGASISGLSWLLKKNKSNSIMFGLATTIATFIIAN